MRSKQRILFTLAIIIFLGIILFQTMELSREQSRLVPIWVSIVTLVLGIGVLASDVSARVAAFFQVSLLGPGFRAEKGYVPRWSERRGFFAISVWFIMLMILFLLFGFYLAIGLCIGVFTKVYGKMSWAKVVLVVGMTLGVTYGLFSVMMGLRMFNGILFGEIM